MTAFLVLLSLFLREKPVCCHLRRWFRSLVSPERIISVHSLSLANARLLPEALCIRRLVIGDIIASMASCASLPFTRAFPVSGYSAGLTNRRPSLLCSQAFATVPLPLHRRVPWGYLPDTFPPPEILPSPLAYRLGTLGSRNCLHAGAHFDAAAIS